MNIDTAISLLKNNKDYCVYMLINGGMTVYVGSSRNIADRLRSHKYGDKFFDSVNFEIVQNKGKMLELESDLIVQHNPELNRTIPDPSRYLKVGKCSELSKSLIAQIVHDMPRCFSRGASAYIKKDVYNKIMDEIENFAYEKIKELEDK